MKKTIILSMVLAATSFMSAQTSKGSMMLGGSLGFSSGKEESTITNSGVSVVDREYKFSGFNFSPTFGYFVADKLAVGLIVDFGSGNNTFTNPLATGNNQKEDKRVNRGTQFGVFARKYMMTNEKFGFYGQLSFLTGSTNNEQTTTLANGNSFSNTRKGPQTNVDLGLGIVYFPSKRIGLHAGFGGLGWNSSRLKSTASTSSNSDVTVRSSGFNFNLISASINFGFSYFFGR